MRIGMVCPYSFDVPGGVQNHVHDLAETLIGLGHQVSVLAPADEGGGPNGLRALAGADSDQLHRLRALAGKNSEAPWPPYLVSAGRAVPVKYNGSVARLSFGPLSAARVRRWLAAGRFDVLHVHEPVSPSLSLLAVLSARGPVVATFHTAMIRSRTMAAAQGLLQIVLERITGRIAVSALARKVQVEHLGGDAVEIPNGVAVARYAGAEPLPGWPGEVGPGWGGTIGFLGRFTEPRKGLAVLLSAFTELARRRPGLRLLVAGPGDPADMLDDVPAGLRDRIVFLGLVPREDTARMLRSVHVYAAPNTGGESFGMILIEAMAAGAPVVASDIDAFRRVLDDGRAGALFPTGDAAALAGALEGLLDDPGRRAVLATRAREVVAGYDWPVIAGRVLEVYTTAIEAASGTVIYEELPDRG